jgi:small nuclear ribonucleoprotein (snRNP)-like protein
MQARGREFMAFSRRHHFKRRERERYSEPSDRAPAMHNLISPEHTGSSEADYLKSLVDSHAKVTVVLTTGERLRGRIRYYDRHCFSIGLSAEERRLFIRKDSVSYISEE